MSITKPVERVETLKIFRRTRDGTHLTTHKNLMAKTQTTAWLTMKQILIAYPWFSSELKQKLLEEPNGPN